MGAAKSKAAPVPVSVEEWVSTDRAQAFVGGPLSRLKEAFTAACPAARIEIDTPAGPRRKRAPAADRLLVCASGTEGGAQVTRVWGYFH